MAFTSTTAKKYSPQKGDQRYPRSAVTNGVLLPGIDGRSAWARRARDVFAQHVANLGGEASINEAQRALVRRIAIISTELEAIEQKSPIDLDLYVRASGALRRLLEAAGLTPATPLDAYLHTPEDTVA